MNSPPADPQPDGERAGNGPRSSPADNAPVLPERAAEDRDEAWGDGPADRPDDWYRRERPPHHG